MQVVSRKILETINSHYNPLGEQHTFLVDKFLIWAKQRGSFYWIWDGAVELANGKEDPKEVIKRLPFEKSVDSPYQDLLWKEWILFLNQPLYREGILAEYENVCRFL